MLVKYLWILWNPNKHVFFKRGFTDWKAINLSGPGITERVLRQ